MIALSGQRDARRVGVVLVGCSGVLGDLVRAAVSGDPDLRVLLEISDTSRHRLTTVVDRLRPDVVVWQLEDDRQLAEHLNFFGAATPCSVLTVLADGKSGSVWRLRPERRALGALSPRTLVSAVREAAARP